MAAVPSREITTSQIQSVGFSFYTSQEIRNLSVKQITSPLALDNLKHPIPDGLYDPALGPLDAFDTCATCGLKYGACPGHFGHIELAVPVYNPLVFGTLYKLLRCTCLHCFRFKMAAYEIRQYETQMELLRQGRLIEASRITTGTGAAVSKASNDVLDDEGEEALRLQGGSIATDKSEFLQRPRSRGSAGVETVHTEEAIRDCQLEFFKRMPATACQNCGAHNPVIKKEGSSKFFQQPLDTKKLMANDASGVTIISALSGMAHSSKEERDLETQMADHVDKEAKQKKSKAELEEEEFLDKGKDDNNDSSQQQAKTDAPTTQPRFMTPSEVKEVMRRLWSNNGSLLQHLYALEQPLSGKGSTVKSMAGRAGPATKEAYLMFFVQTVLVPPNNVRPMSRMGELTFEHPQNTALTQIMNFNLDLVSLERMSQEIAAAAKAGQTLGPVGGVDLGRSLRLWLSLQNSLNGLYDNTTAEGPASNGQGIRQLLEKKEGLFRKNMMGKRVNFACRSVISPDPYLGSGEIGVPPYFAVRLSVPERVTPLNVQELREMVTRGPFEHPGANAVEDENGRLVNLTHMPLQKRESVAKQLLSKQGTVTSAQSAGQGMGGKIVYRHLRDNDVMLTNRQPTLHKPGLMAHRARILKGERTIRMHYANCATFNADFDGDEINLHVPQDLHARAEGYEIVHADHQYIVPTDGKPIRGLIQDHVVAGVQLCMRDKFLTRTQFMQLLYSAVGPSRPGVKQRNALKLPHPTILRPHPLWTGKQVMTAVVGYLTAGKAPLTLTAPCKTSEKYWGKSAGEETLIFHKGELLTGVMDKAQYGKYGLVHAVQELYGGRVAGELLSCLSRLWTIFLQGSGFTCGIGDLLLDPKAELRRIELTAQAERKAMCASAEIVGIGTDDLEGADSSEDVFVRKQGQVQQALGQRYCSSKTTGPLHDRKTTSSLQPISSEVVDICLPGGQVKPFPKNCLAMMTVTGAKGSQVNFSQISCLLGQQELEGRRVPRMASGKTLPCFGAYEGGARSGGYISDRFLTGLRPQEYYFHCMAGREGLVDTTVKTSRSGYLQRCLVKNLESLRVHYDGTVRDCCDGSVVQFHYGEDGIDVLSSSFLTQFGFLSRNAERLQQQQLPGAAEAASKAAALTPIEKAAAKLSRWRQKQLSKKERGKKAKDLDAQLPVNGQYFSTLLGVTSEAYADALGSFIRSNPADINIVQSRKRKSGAEEVVTEGGTHTEEGFQRLMDLRYMRALAAPGEAVGVIAAQSVGEPSTQMTLNTFHMAGRGEANVTLGIPRLRELFMTASKSIKTPVMTLPLLPDKAKEHAEALASKLRRIRLAEVLENLTVDESLAITAIGVARQYTVRLRVFPDSKLPKESNLTFAQISQCFREVFMKRLSASVKKELHTFERNARIQTETLADTSGSAAEVAGATGTKRKKGNKEDDDENAEENEENDEGKLRFAGGRGEAGAMYDQGDKEDREIAENQRREAQLREELPEGEEPGDPRDILTPGKSEGAASKSQYEAGESVDHENCICSATISVPISSPKVLMLELAESIAASTMLRHTPGIEKCYIIEGPKDPANPSLPQPPAIQTDGINFEGAWSADDVLDVNCLVTNDVGSILRTYGVEAARATLMREVSSVFGAYGIGVDPRHLGLIADFMTHQGGYRACSRIGIESSKSTFLKITFETASHFLTDATLKGKADDLSSPASRIVLGRVVELGTGSFELHQTLSTGNVF